MHLHKVVSEDETRLYCFSEERANKDRGIVERFETALTKLSDGLSRPRTRKRVNQVRERIGRLKASNRRVVQHYDVELDTAVRFTRRPVEGAMMTHPGGGGGTAYAPTKPIGTRKSCGEPTSPSPTSKRSSAR